MIIQSGVIIFVGLLFMFFKLKLSTTLKLFAYPLALDVVVFIVTYIMHMGTFSGVMAAAVAALMCSGLTSLGRWYLGYIKGDLYYPGIINVTKRLQAQGA